MTLDSILDRWTNTTTYFWRDSRGSIISPYLDSEDQAHEWLREHLINVDNFKK